MTVPFQRRTSSWSPGTESWAQGESVWGANSLYTVLVKQLQLHREGPTTVRLENIWVWSILRAVYGLRKRLGKFRVLFGCVDDWKYLRWKKITNWSWEFNFCMCTWSWNQVLLNVTLWKLALLCFRSGLLALLQEGGITGVEKQYQQLIDEQKRTYQNWYDRTTGP